jgi:hypothetical protein
MTWTKRNLAVQGYCLTGEEAHKLRAILLPVCGLVTLTNFCIPSTLLGIWWRRPGTPVPNRVPDAT